MMRRTLWERELQEVIPDPESRDVFRKAATCTTPDDPFLREPPRSTAKGLIMNHFVNAISGICSSNFILGALGQPTTEETFIFGLTYEENWNKLDHVKKIRVLLIRDEMLEQLNREGKQVSQLFISQACQANSPSLSLSFV